jgi:hypothetical protein
MVEKSKESRVVRVFLYESFLEEMKGTYYARLARERTLGVGDVSDIVHERGGFTGDPRVMEDHVIRFFDEVGRQVGNGLTVDIAGWLSLHAHVGGSFKSLREGVTEEEHESEIRCLIGTKCREVAETIEVYVMGPAPQKAYIDSFTDMKTKLVNQKATVGGQFILAGDLMKIFGPDEKNGLRFRAPGSPAVSLRVATDELPVNESRRIVGIVPDLPPDKVWTLEITTQYNNSTTPLKERKVITSDFTLTT